MLRPTAINVVPLMDYKLKVFFDNNEIKIFDVKPYIRGDWYGELSDLTYFQSARTNGYNVEWANGQDICPDELYYDSVPIPPETQTSSALNTTDDIGNRAVNQ